MEREEEIQISKKRRKGIDSIIGGSILIFLAIVVFICLFISDYDFSKDPLTVVMILVGISAFGLGLRAIILGVLKLKK